ncbi:hypothetical protein L6452_15008 [Arctium lappa]|uniref:Uncharacterized protein n=1 Tax=Arctium lappa TaxID=4217 RepID=A0ACB9CMP0_ARCLA|nr:hypothetical protein L6452_15008 [Arctium lappa]
MIVLGCFNQLRRFQQSEFVTFEPLRLKQFGSHNFFHTTAESHPNDPPSKKFSFRRSPPEPLLFISGAVPSTYSLLINLLH